MSKFWRVVIVVGVIAVVLIAISFLVPQVKVTYDELKGNSNLPWWIVGLLSPIVFVLKKIGEMFSGLFGKSSTEQSIAQENEDIKAQRAMLLEEVRKLDEWRTRELEIQRNEIAVFEKNIATLKAQAQSLDARFQTIMATSPEKFAEHMTPEELTQGLAGPGTAVSEGKVITE